MIIETRNRGRHLLSRERITGDRITVGRAYDNDIIVDDPYVCPRHLVLFRNDGQWKVEDLGSVNGTQLKGRHLVPEAAADMAPGDALVLGRTHLKLLEPGLQVPATLRSAPLERLLDMVGQPFIAIALTGLICVSFLVSAYLHTVTDFEWGPLWSPLLRTLTLVVGTALALALAGRIFRHQARFLVHLSVICLLWLGLDLLEWLLNWLNYQFPNLPVEWLDTALSCLILGFWVSVFLLLSTNLSHRARIASAVCAGLLPAAFFLVSELGERDTFYSRPGYNGLVMTPPLLLRDPREPAVLYDLQSRLMDNADKLAEEEED